MPQRLVPILRFIALRLIGLFVTAALASFVIYGALSLAPGSPIAFLTRGRTVSPATVQALERHYHLNEPFVVQWVRWFGGILHGDFGTSILYKANVLTLLGTRASNTIFLVAYASILIVLVGLCVGVVAGLRRGSVDSTMMLLATGGMAVPAFVASIVLITVFAVSLGWLPVFGPGAGFGGHIRHMTLPAIALALSSIAYVARLTRTVVRHELGAEHVQTAISRGLPYRVVVRRHVVRNAMVPIVTITGLAVGSLIAGTIVVEQVFQLDGLGSYLVQAVEQKDFPVVQAICLIFVVAFIVLNTVVDLTYAMLDPRIAAQGRGR